MSGRRIVTDWISRSGLDFNHYYPLLMLRMIVTLCLVCANCGSYFNILSRLLDKEDITSWLPRNFIDVLRRKKGRHYLILNAKETKNILAEAFFNIGDPLVVVSVSGNNCMFTCPKAIFVDMNATLCIENILRILFPIKSKVLQEQDVEAEATNSCNNVNDWQPSKASSTSFSTTGEKIIENDNQCKSEKKRFFTKKQISDLKAVFQGFEALDQDQSQLLHSALDSRDVGRCSPLMYDLYLKQYALTGDPLAKAMLDMREVCDVVCLCGRCNDDRPISQSRIAETNANSGKGQKNKNNGKNHDSGNKGKGQGTSKKDKDGRKK